LKRRNSWAILIIWTAIVFVLTGYPSLEAPKIKEFPIDKVYHFIIFLVLGLLAARIFKLRGYLIFCGIAVILAEVQQIWIPGRDFELLDIVAGIVGFVVAYIIFWTVQRRRARHELSKA
jgi:VanZ family protein